MNFDAMKFDAIRPRRFTPEERESMLIDVAVRFGEIPAVLFYVHRARPTWHPMKEVFALWPPLATVGPGVPPSEDTCRCANCFARLLRELAS